MSKFWAGNSSDDDDNDEEEYDESEEGTEEGSEEGGSEGSNEKNDDDEKDDEEEDEDSDDNKKKKKRYIEESDDSDGVRVVKTAKQKYIDSLLDISRNFQEFLNRNKKAGDWTQISSELVILQNQLHKFRQQIKIHGIPGFLIKQIAIVESTQADLINKSKSNKEIAQNYSSQNWKSVNTVGNKLKKFIDEELRKNINKYNLNPNDESYGEPKDEEDKPKDKEQEKKDKGPKRGTREFWVKKPGDESSEEFEEDDLDWLDEETRKKKEVELEEKQKKKEKEIQEKKEKIEMRKQRKNELKKKDTGSKSSASTKETKSVEERIEEINVKRGKTLDNSKLIVLVNKLFNEELDDEQRFRILVLQINLLFDSFSSKKEKMDQKTWRKTINIVNEVLEILTKRKDFELIESGTDDEQEHQVKEKVVVKKEGVSVIGSIITFYETIERHYFTSLQTESPYSSKYLARFSDEIVLVAFIKNLLSYYSKLNDLKKVSYFSVAIMKYTHYKLYSSSAEFEGEDLKDFQKVANDAQVFKFNRSKQLHHLHSFILKNGEPRHKTLSVLYLIYHLALHDQFYQARDKLLLTKIGDFVSQLDLDVQVMYNRANIQIGLCAFRLGFYEDAHLHLHEIYNGQKIKELIAQGIGKYNDDKTSDQLKGEKKRTLPAHMHIPLEMIEAFHLISAVILEVPNMCANVYDTNKKVISKRLRKLMSYWEDSEFKGPPETPNEFILASARALLKGDWQKAHKYLFELKVWNLVPDNQSVKNVLEERLRKVAITAYVLTYGPYYDSISIDFLSQMFNLSSQKIQSYISNLIQSKVLAASWHQPSKTLVVHHTEPSKLQFISSQISDKLVHFVENNERALDTKTGVYGYKNDNTYERSKNNSRIYNRYAKRNQKYY